MTITSSQINEYLANKGLKLASCVPVRVKGKRAEMNRTEDYYSKHLYMLTLSGDILNYYFEAVKLRLADRTWYIPDFMVITRQGIEFHEIKGFWRDDAKVKFKVAKEMHRWAQFKVVKRIHNAWVVQD